MGILGHRWVDIKMDNQELGYEGGGLHETG
jgi:hypothetical protein